MPWKLYRVDNGKELIRDDCTCVDHCKEIARKHRQKNGFKGVYIIYDPRDFSWSTSAKTNGWRMRWDRI